MQDELVLQDELLELTIVPNRWWQFHNQFWRHNMTCCRSLVLPMTRGLLSAINSLVLPMTRGLLSAVNYSQGTKNMGNLLSNMIGIKFNKIIL